LRQKVRTSASEEPPPPCSQNVRTGRGQTPSSHDCGRLLWTPPNNDIGEVVIDL